MTASRTAPQSLPKPDGDPGCRTASGDRLAAALLAETIRAIEQDGPLEDQAVMREAFHTAGGEERLLARASLLAGRLHLDRELARWRGAAWFLILLLALVAFLSAYGIAVALIGSGRTVNAVTAFFGALGLHAVTLVIWVVAVFSHGGGKGFGFLSFGHALLWLLARLPGQRHQDSVTMAHAAYRLLQDRRLLPWAFGAISHTVWAVAFLLVLTALGFAFAFHAYRLTWETTILDADFFVRFVTLTGTLPSWLGFPLPDPATLRDPSATGTDQRAWAWWLIGTVFTYGLLPRGILGLASWAVWRRAKCQTHLDTSDPYYRKHLARFEGMEQSLIEDVEQRSPEQQNTHPAVHAGGNEASVVVGFELPAEVAWPPQTLPAQLALVERIAGTAAERRALLDRLGKLRPHTLLVVCHAASTPDRGTERFLREATHHAASVALLLAAAEHDNGVQRWKEWLSQVALGNIACFTECKSAADWMGNANG